MKRKLLNFVVLLTVLLGNVSFLSMKVYGEEKQIVNPKQVYTYEIMTRDLLDLANKYPDLIEFKSIGKTKYGREIWAVKLGKGSATVFYNGSHHAREWLTTNLLMQMIEQYANAYTKGTSIEGFNVRQTLEQSSIWFVPMVNPDGVTLQQFGVNAFPKEIHAQLKKMNDGGSNFRRWKANAEGIDLNRQYPARWNQIINSPNKPYYMNYQGSAPLVTKEAQALVSFTYEVNPEITLSYHSSGRMIFWDFYNRPEHVERDLRIAKKIGTLTSYQVMYNASKGSSGGYKDWFIQEFGRPSYTLELGYYVGESNLPLSVFDEEWKRNKAVGLFVAQEGYKLWEAKVLAKERIEIEINHEVQNFAPSAVIIQGRTLVPLRSIFENLGAYVSWDSETRRVAAVQESKVIQLELGSKRATINDQSVELDQPATIVAARTMVPLRFMAEALGAEVIWDAQNRMVRIYK